MEQKKVMFVTGGNGFIAYYTMREALSKGYRVITNILTTEFIFKDEFAKELESGDMLVYAGIDIRDTASMYHLVERSDMVIHLAGLLGTKHTRQSRVFNDVNVNGGLNILDACSEFDVPVVFISVGNYFEDNDYSSSKDFQSRMLKKYVKYNNVRGNCVKALNAVGARQKVKNTGKVLPTFITKMLQNQDITVYGGKEHCSVMDLVYVGDVAKVLVNVLEDTISGEILPGKNEYEAGTGLAPSVMEIAQLVIDLGKASGIETTSEIKEIPMRLGETPNSIVVAKNPYPIEYRDIPEVIAEAIEYYKNNTWR